jgi:hypothetical protein
VLKDRKALKVQREHKDRKALKVSTVFLVQLVRKEHPVFKDLKALKE